MMDNKYESVQTHVTCTHLPDRFICAAMMIVCDENLRAAANFVVAIAFGRLHRLVEPSRQVEPNS